MKKDFCKLSFVVIFCALFVSMLVLKEKNEMFASFINNESIEVVSDAALPKGTLYGNIEGTRFCCSDGDDDCGAANCPF